MVDLKFVELGDIAEVTMGQSPKSEYYNTDKEGLPFLQGNKTFGFKYPSFDMYTSSITKIAKKDSILMSVRAPVGDLNIASEDLCIGRGLCSLNMKNDNNNFLYYLLKFNLPNLLNRESGTVFGSINKKDIETLEVAIPKEESIQYKIVDILLSIDNLIIILKKINHNLDSILKNIFNEWFIKFSPFKGSIFKNSELGNIPMDWEIKSLQDISKNIICGKTPSTKNEEYWGDEIPFVTIPDMHNSIYVFNTERYLSKKGSESQIKKLIPPNSICVSCIATAGLVILTSKYCQTNQQINTIICEDNVSPYFIYLYMVNLSKYIQLLGSSGSTTNNLNKKEFSKIKIILPPNKIMKKFSNLVKPLFIKIKKNELEIEKLINLRDLLLPKLMSGEINVSKLK